MDELVSAKNLAAASLGKKGGLAKSPAKTAAAQANGKKGGRPRKPVLASALPNDKTTEPVRTQ
jgi:hypothetical protein